MFVLFDHSTPAPLSPYLVGHTVIDARTRGWDGLSDGDLIVEAERADFEVLVTAVLGKHRGGSPFSTVDSVLAKDTMDNAARYTIRRHRQVISSWTS